MRTYILTNKQLRDCPHTIMVPEHYREDGSCRCNDPDATIMRDWGYSWNPNTGRWE